ncbi:hypothetical protein [Oceanobacillus sp. FSL H7-0719]|uniref:hypothetical protein n=1 Tax=Oceanobacillus sp. FSL H7-0719 TaxID=2954507 RepID=UPI003249DD8F
MTKLAKIMNDYFATEGYEVDEIIVDAEMALDSEELSRELIKFIYHLDEVIK